MKAKPERKRINCERIQSKKGKPSDNLQYIKNTWYVYVVVVLLTFLTEVSLSFPLPHTQNVSIKLKLVRWGLFPNYISFYHCSLYTQKGLALHLPICLNELIQITFYLRQCPTMNKYQISIPNTKYPFPSYCPVKELKPCTN